MKITCALAILVSCSAIVGAQSPLNVSVTPQPVPLAGGSSNLSQPLPSVIHSQVPSISTSPAWGGNAMPTTMLPGTVVGSSSIPVQYPMAMGSGCGTAGCGTPNCGTPSCGSGARGPFLARLKAWLFYNPCSEYRTFRLAPYRVPLREYFPISPMPLGYGVNYCGSGNCGSRGGFLGITGPGGSCAAPRSPIVGPIMNRLPMGSANMNCNTRPGIMSRFTGLFNRGSCMTCGTTTCDGGCSDYHSAGTYTTPIVTPGTMSNFNVPNAGMPYAQPEVLPAPLPAPAMAPTPSAGSPAILPPQR